MNGVRGGGLVRHGGLSSLFDGVAVKRLAAVDACSTTSNQHEITGSEPLLRILGDQDRKRPRMTAFIMKGEHVGETITERLPCESSRRII